MLGGDHQAHEGLGREAREAPRLDTFTDRHAGILRVVNTYCQGGGGKAQTLGDVQLVAGALLAPYLSEPARFKRRLAGSQRDGLGERMIDGLKKKPGT